MTTINKADYDFIAFFDASGSWTCPEKCTEALIIASGGGGGGGTGAGIVNFTGVNGGNGGTTSFVGLDNNLSFPGGAGGAAGINSVSTPPTQIRGPFSGKSTKAFFNYSQVYPTTAAQSAQWWTKDVRYQNIYNALNLDVFCLIASPPLYSYVSQANGRPGQDGPGLNGGIGGKANNSSTASGQTSGGGGGSAIGEKRKVSLTPNSIYSINIGVGGNGGQRPFIITESPLSGGNGGAGGFLIIMWNE